MRNYQIWVDSSKDAIEVLEIEFGGVEQRKYSWFNFYSDEGYINSEIEDRFWTMLF